MNFIPIEKERIFIKTGSPVLCGGLMTLRLPTLGAAQSILFFVVNFVVILN